MEFWDFIGFFFWTYLVITFVGILLGLVFDVFRDPELGGWGKAAWIIFLVVFPLLASVVYVIARGNKMSERQLELARSRRSQADQYIRSVAPASPADEIAKAKALLDSGSISTAEFDQLKSQVLLGTAQGSRQTQSA